MTRTARALLQALRDAAEPVVARQGCELVAVELAGGAGSRRIVRFSVDRAGGATIDDCTRISRQLSPTLDAADLLDVSYDLEVSTPGMDRPLQRERDWRYFVGCTVRLRTWEMDPRRRVKGTLVGVDAGAVTVRTDEGERTFLLDDVERANLVLTFEQFARMGEGKHPVSDAPIAGETP